MNRLQNDHISVVDKKNNKDDKFVDDSEIFYDGES